MGIIIHPEPGTILVCDFRGMESPEMVKRRPVVVISPRLRRREGLCTVVPLSTTEPLQIAPYHFKLHTNPPLPKPYNSLFHWVKGDMLYTVSFRRLFLPHNGKDSDGKRLYVVRIIEKSDLVKIHQCILHGLGMESLTD